MLDAQGRGPERPVPNPSPDRHAATRFHRGRSSSSPPTADGFETGTLVPNPQSQSFSRGYGSILPISLAYIVPLTRDERFARQYRCGPPPEFPLASPRSGIVHHLSSPDRYALTRTLHKRSGSVGGATHKRIPPISFLASYGFTRPLTRTHVRLLGPCFKTGQMASPQADARSTQVQKHAESAHAAIYNSDDDVSASILTTQAWATITIRIGQCLESIVGPAQTVPHSTETHRRPPSASLPIISSTL
ncbi:hypothetical protein KIW84_056518 [Lathyrus oleraceus]|uniref:Senescence-associated protein n=1 Tax=Pisum sativum TaxID=3888 RepID=A0A9D4X0V1_PEA|nr:hypothetical protein KIW84_056518 [Pisum sativum]